MPCKTGAVILFQQKYASPFCSLISIQLNTELYEEAANTNLIVLGLTRLGIEPTIYRKASMLTITTVWFL
jgi:hypothetical protein